ncbi:MAG: NH(3)-dependent NAD(+) synthetase [Microgenomates group bacterium GW2011_GWF2_45_18]|nr:MAG: NH(3)-dependent NAD(+) synthetase [Microgenomates group bacterium GW2011_GWF1_44_10]KKU02167.1 MAG: NH(3)-dependent NAD(+) synthetase [Microgenomates group bacterium GW2011_GWF2_45_18]OGJ41604.1 MAG: NAD(+) synthase [Candidatus Pacebacteria bacterium RIFOXYB1_FULL_44_10]
MITLPSPQYEDHIVFLRTLYEKLQKPVVVGVSGGIDSAVALTLLARVIPKEKIIPVLLPHHLQNMDDAKQIIAFNQIPESQTHIIDIAPMVQSICDNLQIEKNDHIRRGNIKARVRMITLFDLAKKYEAVVCGTENKSEKRLGYFTRFGDSASDIEPISTLYKTQVRELAQQLTVPKLFIEKTPSAGLWENQSDEQELGFTYHDADQIMYATFELGYSKNQIMQKNPALNSDVIQRVLDQVASQQFKQLVPYSMEVAPNAMG